MGHTGYASFGALLFGFASRSIWQARTADGQCRLFFRDRAALRIRAEFHDVSDLRAMFGIGMGGEWGSRIAGDGGGPSGCVNF